MKKGTVVINTRTQRYGCGALRLRKGAIVKLAEETLTGMKFIDVFRSIDSQNHYDEFGVELKHLRKANDIEVMMYNDGIKTLKDA